MHVLSDTVSNAVVEWLVDRTLTAGSKAAGSILRGDKERDALRDVVRSAIRLAVGQLVSDPQDADVVVEALLLNVPGDAEITIGDVPTLGAAVKDAIQPRLAVLAEQGYHVQVDELSEIVEKKIADGIQAESAHTGSPLKSAASVLRYRGLLGTGEEAVEQLRRMNDRMDDVFGKPLQSRLVVKGPAEPDAAILHILPPDIGFFTDRTKQMRQATSYASRLIARRGQRSTGALLVIDGMPGVGKTAFAVHVAHRLAPKFPDGQIFVRLHAHTPGQHPVEPGEALISLLRGAGVSAEQIPSDVEAKAAMWRDRIAARRVVLILDDASSSDQVLPLLPRTAECVVLLTTRRRLTALADATPISLEVFDPVDSGRLLGKLAGRGATEQDPEGADAIGRLCGYLPLAITLTAGRLKHHPNWQMSDLVQDLSATKNRVSRIQAENQSVAAAFDLSYRELPVQEQLLFRRLGLHPGAEFDAQAVAALADIPLNAAEEGLERLYVGHMIDEAARGRYRLHDLIRQHAANLADLDRQAERDSAVDRLIAYYLSAAASADRHLARRSHTNKQLTPRVGPSYVPSFRSPLEANTWMERERDNLIAIANYSVLHGRTENTVALAIAMHGFLRTSGHWDQALALHRTALAVARAAGDQLGEAETLNNLGVIQRLKGDYSGANTSLADALKIYRELHNRLGEANAMNYLGVVRRLLRDYESAMDSFGYAIRLYEEEGDLLGQANALNYLGVTQVAIKDYQSAKQSQEQALLLYQRLRDRFGEANALLDLGAVERLVGDYADAVSTLERALNLYSEIGSKLGQANALKYIGAIQEIAGDYESATANLMKSLALYGSIGSRLGEANALKNLAVVQEEIGDLVAAAASLDSALDAYKKVGNRQGEATTLIALGDLAVKTGDLASAHVLYDAGLEVARVIRSVLDEARGLEGKGVCYLALGSPADGGPLLLQALSIYRTANSPFAERVETTLRTNGIYDSSNSSQ